MRITAYIHKNKLPLCALCITASLPIIIFSILAFLWKAGNVDLTSTAHELLGDWSYWLIVIGFILLIGGSYYMFVFLRQLKEYKSLINEPSKAKFIKNLDRLEELAWRLHPRYERIVIDRKKKFKIK
jgi:hypothetical protein